MFGVIFDIDGTVLDSLRTQFVWLKQVADKFKGTFPWIKIDEDFRLRYSEATKTKGIEGLYDMIGVNFKNNNRSIWTDYQRFNAKNYPPVIYGMREIVLACQAIHEVAFNTVKRYKDVAPALKKEKLLFDQRRYITGDVIRHVVYSTVPGASNNIEEAIKKFEKPHPLSGDLAVRILKNVGVKNIVAVEDTVEGVRTYEIPVIGVTWGYGSLDELREETPYIAETPEQLRVLINQLSS